MLEGEVELSPHLSNEVADLISRILKVSPDDRYTIDNIEKHPWVSKQIVKNSLLMMKSIR